MAKSDKYSFEKVLRIGVAKQQSILGEHLLLPQNTFSIGMHEKSDFLVDGLLHHTLFQTKEGSYYLNFTPKMDGKVMEAKSSPTNLDVLRTQKEVSCKGDVYSVRLSETSRGKISIGDITFIFQFIDAPPLAQRVKYLKEEKFIEDDDLLFLSFSLFNSLCATLLLVYANFYHVIPEPPELTAEQIAQILDINIEPDEEIVQEEVVDEEAVSDDGIAAEEKKEPSNEPDQTEDVIQDDSSSDSNDKMSEEQIDAALGELENLNVAAILGAEGSGAPVLSSMSTFSEDSSEISISKTDTVSGGGLKVATAGEKALNTDSNIKVKKAKGGGKVKVGGGPKVKVRKGKVKAGKMKASSNKCDTDIKKVVKKKQGNINFCYDRVVKDDASLAGKIKLSITIKSGGNKVSFAKDDIKSKDLTSCIKRKVKKWKFPPKCDTITFQKTYILKTDN
jgi:hypothetical protein